jgi:hypothetical protein
MKKSRVQLGLILSALILAGGCKMVHYRFYGFEWVAAETPPGVGVEVVATGTSVIQDRGGFIIERRTSPYWVGIYFDRLSRVPIEVLRVTFVGERTGSVITPSIAPPKSLGDGSLTVVSVAPAVRLPFEDYRVELQVRIGAGTEALVVPVTGTLNTKLEESKALLFWERMRSV